MCETQGCVREVKVVSVGSWMDNVTARASDWLSWQPMMPCDDGQGTAPLHTQGENWQANLIKLWNIIVPKNSSSKSFIFWRKEWIQVQNKYDWIQCMQWFSYSNGAWNYLGPKYWYKTTRNLTVACRHSHSITQRGSHCLLMTSPQCVHWDWWCVAR